MVNRNLYWEMVGGMLYEQNADALPAWPRYVEPILIHPIALHEYKRLRFAELAKRGAAAWWLWTEELGAAICQERDTATVYGAHA